MNKLYIIGCGPGNNALITVFAKDIIEKSDIIFSTSDRLYKSDKKIVNLSLNEIYEKLEQINNSGFAALSPQCLLEVQSTFQAYNKNNICLLVSGDVNFHSCSRVICEKYGGIYDISLINGLSSLQYFSTKLGQPYQNWQTLTLHGHDSSPIAKVCYNEKVFMLTGGKNKAEKIANSLFKAGLKDIKITVGENLSMEDERIVEGPPSEIKDLSFKDLAVMLVENKNFQNPHIPLWDKDFIRGKTPMTKEEIRWLSIKKMGITSKDIVYDIGAGTGSVAIEIARTAYDSLVYAFEIDKTAIDLINKNREKHGAYNLNVIEGKAPECLKDAPCPNKAFIGGSSGKMEEIIQTLINKNPEIVIVANAITLEGLNDILAAFKKYNFLGIDISCVNVAKSEEIGNYHMMMGQNPIYIIRGEHHG